MEQCACPSAQFTCHAEFGCVCRHGFSGADCLKLTRVSEPFAHEPDSNTAGVAWGVVIVLILCGVIVMVMLHYRRRLRNLKTVIADVEYHAHPPGHPPDRNHFDNPVYAFNDNAQLLNNLRPNKPSNMERLKRTLQPQHLVGGAAAAAGASSSEQSSEGSGRAGAYSVEYNTEMTQKNMNADLTNPNLYHSIDDNSEEHVYDEIKQKEGYKEPGKCGNCGDWVAKV